MKEAEFTRFEFRVIKDSVRDVPVVLTEPEDYGIVESAERLSVLIKRAECAGGRVTRYTLTPEERELRDLAEVLGVYSQIAREDAGSGDEVAPEVVYLADGILEYLESDYGVTPESGWSLS